MNNIYIWLNISYGYQLSEKTQTFLQINVESTSDFKTVLNEILEDGMKWTHPSHLDSVIFDAKFKDHKMDFAKFNGGQGAFKSILIKKWNKKFSK